MREAPQWVCVVHTGTETWSWSSILGWVLRLLNHVVRSSSLYLTAQIKSWSGSIPPLQQPKCSRPLNTFEFTTTAHMTTCFYLHSSALIRISDEGLWLLQATPDQREEVHEESSRLVILGRGKGCRSQPSVPQGGKQWMRSTELGYWLADYGQRDKHHCQSDSSALDLNTCSERLDPNVNV